MARSSFYVEIYPFGGEVCYLFETGKRLHGEWLKNQLRLADKTHKVKILKSGFAWDKRRIATDG